MGWYYMTKTESYHFISFRSLIGNALSLSGGLLKICDAGSNHLAIKSQKWKQKQVKNKENKTSSKKFGRLNEKKKCHEQVECVIRK